MTVQDKEIGARLKRLREEQGWTTTQLANYLKMDQSNYSKIEHGKRGLRKLSQLEKLCTLYGCTQEHILYGEPHSHMGKTVGSGQNVDLNIVAQMNMTMGYLKTLRRIKRKNEE